MCRAHDTERGFVGELVSRSMDLRDVVLDMEAGLEHFSRGTARHVSCFLAVLEPYYRSMETVRRVAELATELGARQVLVVANKVRNDGDRTAITEFCSARGLRLAAEIPYDPLILEAERAGRAPFDYRRDSPAMGAVQSLARTLRTEVS